jgi:myo-inositol-1-phosphate synthase
MGSVRVAIVGVGNCATSLIQGVHYYKDADPANTVPGLMHVTFGEYHVNDVEFVAAFDVDDKKVGKDLSEAINASENNTIKIADVPDLGIEVQRGPTLDGLGKYYRQTIEESGAEPVDVVQGAQGDPGRRPRLLPPGGLRGGRQVLRPVRDRRRRGLRQRAARLHRLRPGVGQEVRGRRRPDRRRRHQVAGRRHHHPPRAGQAVRGPRRGARTAPTSSTSAATWTSRTCSSASAWSPRRSPRPRPSRRTSGRAGRQESDRNVHIGPSDYVAWLDDRKWAYVRLEGRAFGDVPLNLEYKLEVWDSPNSAGIIIDAIRAAKIAKDRGIGGPIISASSYLMKSPPVQLPDDEGRRRVEAFIRGEE